MRAMRLNELGDPWDLLRLEELEPPQPTGDTSRIRVEACDLNFADILQCQGLYQERHDPPFTPGLSAAGVIDAVGPDSPFAIGQRVIGTTAGGWGGYAEQALLASTIEPVPDDIDGLTASAINVTHGTAWFALHQRGHLQRGESVLVLAAAGGVGSAAVQMAKAHDCTVIAAAGGPEKVDLCRRLGADVVIDYRADDLYDSVMEATSGRGVDVVYDPVGGESFDVARRLLAWEGRLLVVGFASGDIPSAPANHVLVKNYSVVGVHMGGYRTQAPEALAQCYAELYEMLRQGLIEPVITEQVNFDTLGDALHRLANRGTSGRVVFAPQ
ncbi:MAG: NADPH:quinone oxidoreductase family protein [Actinomycetia bacterium]|nr:NADPH:quinone oxidoreductase family protein [Actinomycetes bacterium]